MAKVLIIGKGRSGEAAARLARERGDEVTFAEGCDLVVASPGVPVKSELQYGCEELKRRGWKLLAVTGSKGKSSVVKLCAEALGGIPCGNYGRPVTDLIGEESGWAVVEVSSFQLETTTLPPDTFEAAAILNLQEDHLNRHGSKAVYHELKRRLLGYAKVAVTDRDAALAQWRPDDAELYRGSYFDNAVLRGNADIAVALLRAAGLDAPRIAAAFAAFRPLPHRFETVVVAGGVRYVDDSKATSLAALSAGLRMCGEGARVRLIAGGQAKGDDPAETLADLTRWAKKVYIIGTCAPFFYSAWSGNVKCELCETLERAVESAVREAEAGETVLLSPGTASFDQFKSFEERGETFARLVQEKVKIK